MSLQIRRVSEMGLVVASIVATGCDVFEVREPVRIVQVTATKARASGQYQIDAEMRGPLTGVKYRFFADDGACDPEMTNTPKSVYVPPPGAQVARITVQVLLDGKPLDSRALDLNLTAKEVADSPPVPVNPPVNPPLVSDGDAAIEITRIPRYDPYGGPDTRDEIGGVVHGVANPDQYCVVLYALTDFWYVQPLLGSSTEIGAGGKWSTWTHTGSSYVALLVRKGYSPKPLLDQRGLPRKGGEIVDISRIVEGVR